ncbi:MULTISPECIES: GNAT family N-acetyltransferase [unclassified Sphingobium]|uniref:GNAT family N-acetyltransferase n=1 Tax=unclassified Sphingobium TaxID=2611147 RepID=UPI0022246FB8|nr:MULTISPECIES: GNAT family N-acetyltransferase [unclassified Sphingobium]MCW2395910.1 ribosomal protein S18 acetylase RimI-like enzyme [Sphingobium sp. B8D3B]MCW2419426.1 ribosomal protein S18 acetylase RimI-like enzyme [Sphingobium sp. B8D3C]
MPLLIRTASFMDADFLPDVERSAASVFRRYPDLAWVADAEPQPPQYYLQFIGARSVWVAVVGERVMGFLAAEQFESDLHINEVSVVRHYQRQGIGRKLIDTAQAYAQRRACTGLTLTTFRYVPWNAPYYERLGFRILGKRASESRLRRLVAQEVTSGFAPESRCAMRKNIGHDQEL